ncbi:MAG: hypothetical protein H6742_04885 [Alphaproteobacteria bacterium]|nr:hypothetical protein [Alphaproteobacteria bacterium]
MRAPSTVAAAGILGLGLLSMPFQTACSGCASDTTIIPKGDPDPVDTGTEPEEPEPFENDWGQWLSMDVMQDGSPAIASYDRTKGALAFAIADLSGETVEWTHEKPDGYTNDDGLDVGNRGAYASMKVAGDGTVWIVYQDLTLENMRWARRDPATGEWENNTADGGGSPNGTGGHFASLALDPSSHPVAVHHDEALGTLRMARYDGSGWDTDVIDAGEPSVDATGAEVEADVGEFAKIAIADGVEYIAYYDKAAGNLKLAWGTPGNYTIEVVDDGGGPRALETGGDVGQWPDILIHDSTIWIAYHDVGNQDLLLAHGEPGNWSIEVVDDGEFVGADSDLFVNGDKVSVAYFDGRNNDMKVAQLVGDAWQLETVTGDGVAQGFHNEVVESNGNYWAACYDYTNRTVWFDKLR